MLVLSRREGDKIVFPNLGVTIELVRVKGASARLGIDAPKQLRVLRHELATPIERLAQFDPEKLLQELGYDRQQEAEVSHELRNYLNTLTLGLELLHKQWKSGDTSEAELTLEAILTAAHELSQAQGANEVAACHAAIRALVVEDNQNESELLAGFLRCNGFNVDTVNDGSRAITYLQENDRPDIVLLDLMMPNLNGRETVEAIRSNPLTKDLRILAVSGTTPESIGLSFGPQGLDQWFQKPVNPQLLLDEIEKLVNTTAA